MLDAFRFLEDVFGDRSDVSGVSSLITLSEAFEALVGPGRERSTRAGGGRTSGLSAVYANCCSVSLILEAGMMEKRGELAGSGSKRFVQVVFTRQHEIYQGQAVDTCSCPQKDATMMKSCAIGHSSQMFNSTPWSTSSTTLEQTNLIDKMIFTHCRRPLLTAFSACRRSISTLPNNPHIVCCPLRSD